MSEVAITLTFDPDQLHNCSDERLATLWHVAQANPAPHGDHQPGDIAEKVGREIIRRWLGSTAPALWHHTGRSYYWRQLTRFARYEPGGKPGTPEWHEGTWHLKDGAPHEGEER